MSDQPEKLDLTSLDIAAEQREKLKAAFPEVFTEGGKVDFERLKMTLGEMVDAGKERYGMNWPGKAECFRTIQTPSRATLRPCREESVNFDTTENLIIEGDNLEVLKLLQKGYLGKVKMIYIDPPYNTGNDFIYPDNYSEDLETYLSYTGQVDAEGRKFSTNTETDGRFHSKWMNMMYPRLFLARNLLREDGVIFISIDDHEVENLKRVCNEVFGEENFIDTLVWQKKVSPSNDAHFFSNDHEYILVYSRLKQKGVISRLGRTEEHNKYYTNPDNDPRGPWNSAAATCSKSSDERPNLYYPIKNPNTGEDIWPRKEAVWATSKDKMLEALADNRIYWGGDGKSKSPRFKLFLSEAGRVVPRSILTYKEVGHTQSATSEFRELLPDAKFDYPKPSSLLNHLLNLSSNGDGTDDYIVLDFFAGSGTSGHAVLELNNQDSGSRKFILVQLPEKIDDKVFKTVADVTEERVRRVIKQLNDANEGQLGLETNSLQDRGFRVFKLDTSNFTPWDGNQPEDVAAVAKQLDLHVEHIVTGRSQEDILTELLLKSGFPLSTKVEQIELAGKKVFSVEEGAMLVCLEAELTNEVIKAMAEKKPSRVICLDAGFHGNDQLKTNAVQTMKARGVTSFRTV